MKLIALFKDTSYHVRIGYVTSLAGAHMLIKVDNGTEYKVNQGNVLMMVQDTGQFDSLEDARKAMEVLTELNPEDRLLMERKMERDSVFIENPRHE